MLGRERSTRIRHNAVNEVSDRALAFDRYRSVGDDDVAVQAAIAAMSELGEHAFWNVQRHGFGDGVS